MRLIDADALIADIEKKTKGMLEQYGFCIDDTPTKEYLNMFPTIDAVEVVRCKDCKYCYSEGFVNVRNVCEKHYDFGNVDDDWFCKDGERRDPCSSQDS